MLQLKTYKYRVYPTDEQIDLLVRTAGCARFVWNNFLNYHQDEYKINKLNISKSVSIKMLL